MAGKIFLMPSQMGESEINISFPGYNLEIIQQINYYVVENERTARRQLIRMGINTAIDDLTFFILNKHTTEQEIHPFFSPLEKDEDIAVLSEAGAPGIADPGSLFITLAHKKNISIVPLVGPSSIFMGLMSSGFNGQQFCFHGYLPVKSPQRKQKIKDIEKRVKQFAETQIFIETPYRNSQMLDELFQTCFPDTRLCIASMITTDEEFIKTKTIKEWKQQKPDLHKLPTVFLLGK